MVFDTALSERVLAHKFFLLFFFHTKWRIHYSSVIKIVRYGERAPLLIRAPDTARSNYFDSPLITYMAAQGEEQKLKAWEQSRDFV